MKWFCFGCRRRLEISLLAAGALSEEAQKELKRHLAACKECRIYYGEIKALTEPLLGWEQNLSAIEATPAAQRRWARAVQESGSARLPWPQYVWRIVWGELLWPSRYAWSGIVALWVVMLVINGRLSDPVASGRPVSSQEMIQAWEEQTRVLAELIQPAPSVEAELGHDVLRNLL